MEDFTFKIFNAEWQVTYIESFKDEVKDGECKFGDTDYTTNTIKVALKNNEGTLFPKKTVELTTLHEMVHAILGTGQYNNSTTDEPLVEWLANCIYSLKEQHKL